MRGLYSHSREYRKIFLRDRFPHIVQILKGIHFGANTCRACTRTLGNTGKYSWRIIYVLVSCQGVLYGTLPPPKSHDTFCAPISRFPTLFLRNPQMWERAHVGFGGTGRKRKGPCTKQCAWRKHGSSDTRLAEACPPKLRNTVKYRVEEMRPKWTFWKHRAPKMRLVEAQCAHRKHCYPKIPLGSHPTSQVSQVSPGLQAPQAFTSKIVGIPLQLHISLRIFSGYF